MPILKTLAALSVLAVLAAGCATSQPNVRSAKDPAIDLGSYQTFGFFEPKKGATGYSTILGQHLKQATRTQLEKQGYRYSDDNPDLKVNVFLAVVERQQVRTTPGFGYRPWIGRGEIETVNYREGTLGVDLVDAKKMALVWRGVAEGKVDEKSMKDPGPAIQAAVAEVFATFPNQVQQTAAL